MADVRTFLNPQGDWSNVTVYSAKGLAASTFDGTITVSAPVVNYTNGKVYYYPLATPSTAGVTPPTALSGWVEFAATSTSGAGTVTNFIATDGGGFDFTVTTSTTTPTLSAKPSFTGFAYSDGTTFQAAGTAGSGNALALTGGSTSWTPVLTCGTPGDLAITYSTQTGSYVQIGALIIARFNITTSAFTHTTASGAISITGLPVTAALSSSGSLQYQGITKASYTSFVPAIAATANTITVDAGGSAQTLASLAITDLPTGGSVILKGTILFTV